MNRLEHGGIFSLRIQVCPSGDADRTDDRRPQIGKNVAKEIRSHDHIKPVRMPHEMRRKNVDVKLIGADIGIILARQPRSAHPRRAWYK